VTKGEHAERHKMLHKNLDELVADWINEAKGTPSEATILELMEWSNEQTKVKEDKK